MLLNYERTELADKHPNDIADIIQQMANNEQAITFLL
jgi:hypothetical protein